MPRPTRPCRLRMSVDFEVVPDVHQVGPRGRVIGFTVGQQHLRAIHPSVRSRSGHPPNGHPAQVNRSITLVGGSTSAAIAIQRDAAKSALQRDWLRQPKRRAGPNPVEELGDAAGQQPHDHVAPPRRPRSRIPSRKINNSGVRRHEATRETYPPRNRGSRHRAATMSVLPGPLPVIVDCDGPPWSTTRRPRGPPRHLAVPWLDPIGRPAAPGAGTASRRRCRVPDRHPNAATRAAAGRRRSRGHVWLRGPARRAVRHRATGVP